MNGTLQQIITEHGYVDLSGSAKKSMSYLKDHLGNNRIVIDQTGAIVHETAYYPSETTMWDSEMPRKFGDKELDKMFDLDFYDFEARQYDPLIMRFTTIDPMREKYYGVSPYAYCNNNPVNRIDPDGRDEFHFNGKEWEKLSDIGESIGVDFYHMGIYNDKGQEITNVTDRNGNWIEMNDGRNILAGGEIRDNDTNWKAITEEFTSGTGPAKSVFEGDHPANAAIQDHYLYEEAAATFDASGKGKDYIKVDWRPKDIIKTGTKNGQAQMMGSYGVSFYKLGDKTLKFIYDSKSKTSLYLHLPVKNEDRKEGENNRQKTTRQLYLFY